MSELGVAFIDFKVRALGRQRVGMGKLTWWGLAGAVSALCVASTMVSPAQTLTTLASFNGANGAYPATMSLVQGTDGNFYGTSYGGGNYTACRLGCGTVFKVTPAGVLTALYAFSFTDGANPFAGLVLGTDGNFYGTTSQGGSSTNCFSNGCGTVFKITPTGALTMLHDFDSADGSQPESPLLLAADGNFYGTTNGGGLRGGYGTLFKITSEGTLSSLHSFNGSDGSQVSAGLVQAANGLFYGTSATGGATNDGTVFKTGPGGGLLATLDSFNVTDGYLPIAGLIQSSSGNFYGTTSAGGSSTSCSGGGCGTVFEITAAGALTSLHSFDSSDGSSPEAGLVQAGDGNFYSTVPGGGANGYGAVFKITPVGALTVLHSFESTDGANPYGGLLQATNGTFYGTTSGGGANGEGTVFRLAVGLRPFVKTVPASGSVGTPVIILGSALTGATSVTFNGTPAAFTVHSGTFISANVPGGATTGKVEVTTPSHRLLSSVPFRVTQ